jgi:5-methylcytosine-specific restriction endonuclease McrA
VKIIRNNSKTSGRLRAQRRQWSINPHLTKGHCRRLPLSSRPLQFGSLLPLFPWPKAATHTAVRSERYLRAQRQTFLGLDALRIWTRSRSERDAKSLLLERYGSWQLRRVLSTIFALDRDYRIGFTTLGVLTSQEVVDLLVERWAPLTIPHEDVRSADLLNLDQLATLRRRSAEVTERLRNVPNPLRRQWIRTRKGLLRLRARDAALREEGEDTLQERQSRIFATLMSLDLQLRPSQCPHCKAALHWTVQYGIPPGEAKLINPHVVSVDAITPRVHGGRYTQDNIAFVCWSCNTAKGHGSVLVLKSSFV